MKVAVRYFSRGGNAAKLAQAIAAAVGVEALSLDSPLTEAVDVLFLGSSVYANGVDEQVKKFIAALDVPVGRVVNFSTAAFVKSTYKQVGRLLREKGIAQAGAEFYCRGSFGPLHPGKPDQKDLAAAAAFAKNVIGC